jgi:hypothetical protein
MAGRTTAAAAAAEQQACTWRIVFGKSIQLFTVGYKVSEQKAFNSSQVYTYIYICGCCFAP